MKTTFYKNLKAFTLCAGFFSLAACKEKSTVKPDLIPGVDSINTFAVSNFNISVKNTYEDSLWTNDYTYMLVGIGGITNDAFYGKTAAGAYLQFAPPSEGFSFPAGTVIDSSILSLPYINFSYGDTSRTDLSHAMHLKAYRITDPFALGDGSRKFYSFDKLAYSTVLGEGDITIKSMNDTFAMSSGDTVSQLLRLKLNPTMNNLFQTMSPDNLSSTATFLDFFRGIYLGPDTTKAQNTLSYFALSGGNSSLNYSVAQVEFYYHTQTDTTRKSAFFKFVSTTCSFFNSISRNYNGFPILSYLNNQAANSDSILVQGYPGFRSDLTVKLDNIPMSVINNATLTVTVLKTGDEARFNAPARLLVKAVDSNGAERIVADMANADGSLNATGQSFVGGTPAAVTIGGVQFTQYTLNIPRELQQALSQGKTELKLRLASSITYPGAFRMIADGPNGGAGTKLRFDVIYSKLNQ